jgi:serine/threonine protein kinase
MSAIDNKYRLLSLLSKNEVSSVYLGEYMPTGRYVIIKIPVVGQEQAALARFEKEYNILVGLDHPNIVRVIDFSDSFPYLVLEYIDGENALATYKNRSVPLDESYSHLLQLHGAIKYLHFNRFIHRDIKPSNIIIEKHTKRAVLVDFETARDISVEDNTGIHSGDFSPHELVTGQSGYFTDVYSLAKMAIFMLSNKSSIDKITLYHRLSSLMEEDYRKRSVYVDGILSILPTKPLVYAYQDGIVNKLYPITQGEARIGRDRICEIKIDDINAYVDEVHAVIRKENEAYVIHDNNSINGLWVFDRGNFIRIAQHILRNDDVLSLGWNSRNGPYMTLKFFL